MSGMGKRSFCFLICLIIVVGASAFPASAYSYDDPMTISSGIVAWKKATLGIDPGDLLINADYSELAGSPSGDWYTIALSRLGANESYGTYLSALKAFVESLYAQPDGLGKVKATDLHRISLAILAAGGDPLSEVKNISGDSADLIADGVYDRGRVSPLGQQGINGWIWGLIALDSMRYAVPEGAFYTRDDIIVGIISRQLADGGFALGGSISDPDITAMAIQALAPYYNSEKSYTYTSDVTGKQITATVRSVIDTAVSRLSELQLGTGDFGNYGGGSSESTSQALIALCCLGIDPFTDERFIKNGNTVFDGLMRYRNSDGGFAHSVTDIDDGSGVRAGESNSVSGRQALCAMAALYRQSEGLRTLYDFRPEHSPAMRARLASLEDGIKGIGADTDSAELEGLLSAFYSIPEGERSYVRGYAALSDAARARGIDIKKIEDDTDIIEDEGGTAGGETKYEFTDSDLAALNALPERLTTAHYTEVLILLGKIELCDDFDGREEYLRRLTSAKSDIEAIQSEIDDINDEVKEKLYPFENLSLKDRKTVNSIAERYYALSEYDRTKVYRSEDILKAKAKLDGELRSVIVGAFLTIAAAAVVFFLGRGIYMRCHKKDRELTELAEKDVEKDK